MNLSRRLLEEFLRRPLDPRETAERLAMLGAPVDAVEPVAAELRAVSTTNGPRRIGAVPIA